MLRNVLYEYLSILFIDTHTHTHTHTRPVPGPMVDTKIWGCSCSIAGPSCLQMWIQPTLDHKHDPWGTRYVVSLSTDVEPINTEGLPCFYWKKIYTLNPYCSKVNAVCVCMYVYIPFCKQKYKHTRKGNVRLQPLKCFTCTWDLHLAVFVIFYFKFYHCYRL